MRKLRHPHQAMEMSDLVANEWYRTPTLYRDGHLWDFKTYLLLGVVLDSPRAALGHEEPDASLFFRVPPHPGTYSGSATPCLLTVHKDGWFGRAVADYPPPPGDLLDAPTLCYWNARGEWQGWDHMASYLGEPRPDCGDKGDMHCIMVPEAAWLADPRIHVVDWINPDDTVVRAGGRPSGDLSDPLAGARRRTDDNLRRFFGFG